MAPQSKLAKGRKRKKSLSDQGGSPQKQKSEHPKKKLKKDSNGSGSEYQKSISEDGMEISEDEKPELPVKPNRRAAGRPRNTSKRDTKPATKESAPPLPPAISTYLEPVTPPNKSKKPKRSSNTYTPRMERAVAFAIQPPIYEMDISPEQKQRPRHRSEGDKLRTLNFIKHDEDNGWELLGKSRTEHLYKQFDEWKNDYSPQNYDICDGLVSMQFMGHPCDRPKDIRARPFLLDWNRDLDRKVLKKLKKGGKPIYRAEYICLGACAAIPKSSGSTKSKKPVLKSESESESESSSDNSDDDSDDSDSDDSNASHKKRLGIDQKIQEHSIIKNQAKKPGKCPHKVKIHVEIRTDDLSTALIYQQHRHEETHLEFLDMSPCIRQHIMELSSIANMTATQIKKRLLIRCSEDQTPKYRWPTPSQVNNIVQNVRRKERLLTDPLKAIGLFAQLNPDKIFCYSEVDYSTDPPSNFKTGIQHPFAIQAMILWAGQNGLGFDSSYRHKNENRAPVTFLTTLDENSHMIPGPVFLSSDVTTPTLTVFLRKVKDLVEEMAKDLVNGNKEIDLGLTMYPAELLAQARTIAQSGWSPHFFMIDKCKAERLAIYNVFPTATIRICQFHVMQAILRWDKEHGDSFEPQPRPRLSLQRKHALLDAVRRLQRCRFAEDWNVAVRKFEVAVQKLCEGSSAKGTDVLNYFRTNWFSDDWKDLWTDIGLPSGELREKMLSTNNWTERAFKTFDQVFLGGRANKSAYRLVIIIANEWFEYYRFWRNQQARPNQQALEKSQKAYDIWNSGKGVQEFKQQMENVPGKLLISN